MKTNHRFSLWLALALVGLLCRAVVAQPADANQSARLSPQPWHLAAIWWTFEEATQHFESLEVDITIDRDAPDTLNLYIAPMRDREDQWFGFLRQPAVQHQRLANTTNQTR